MKLQYNRKEVIFLSVFTSLCLLMIFVPTGFGRAIYVNAVGAKAKVLSTNDSMMYQTGIVRMGEQRCTVEVLTGPHKGEQVEGINLLTGRLEFDKVFTKGQLAWVLLEQDHDDNVLFTNMVDHYRFAKELQLMALFAILLIIFSGFTGIRTLLSFLFAFLSIWKILIPLSLKGYSPMLLALIVGTTLTVVTLLLVGGCTKKALAAIIGAVGSSLITCLLAVLFTLYLGVHGSVMQWSESLLYAGYMKLDLTKLFQAAVYLSCSGAILDLSIDISAALNEIIEKKPSISARELVVSGLTIGKSVVGSQTTTLLLAYMGSYLTVMMVYMAQGTPIMSILNSKTIAAEILHTFVGCIGLVLVSPLTSLVCGWLYTRKKTKQKTALKNEGSPMLEPMD